MRTALAVVDIAETGRSWIDYNETSHHMHGSHDENSNVYEINSHCYCYIPYLESLVDVACYLYKLFLLLPVEEGSIPMFFSTPLCP